MTANVTTIAPSNQSDEQRIKSEALTIVERAKIVKITSQETYDEATSLLLDAIKPLRKKWKIFWYGDTDSGPIPLAYKAYKGVLDKFTEADRPLEVAENTVKRAIGAWETEQARIQQEAQRKAQEKAEECEWQERLQQVAQLVDDPFASENDAEAIMKAPPTAVAAPVEPTFHRATGVSTRKNFKARVTDMKALCKAIGAGKVPVTYVLPNESVLNARARADELTLNIPGVIAYNDTIVSGRSR